MLFHTAAFAVFFAVCYGLFLVLPGTRPRKALLCAASYLFYAHWDWRYVSLLLLSTALDYAVGLRMHAAEGRARKLWLTASLAGNLGALAVFKYGRFALENLARVGLDLDPSALPAEVPVGISFYTFQTLSYSIDVYRRRTGPCRSPLDFALFVAFFPQLVAGPIVRGVEFLPQLSSVRPPRATEVALGAQRFVLGLFKKVVLADHAALYVDRVFAEPEAHTALLLWGGMYAFALQIYLDFSAYTDMALGLARAFGFRFPENFDAPYLARSITEFWRRWHMTLSRWLRDYLYVPLGGSREGRARTYANLLLTMLLGGLWHGAAWTFVLWGAYHGALLALERALGYGRDAAERTGPVATLARRVLTFHLVCVGWVLFRAESLQGALSYLGRMATAWSLPAEGAAVALAWSAVTAAIVIAQGVGRRRGLRERAWRATPAPLQGFALAALLLCVAVFPVHDAAFIYFQF